MVNGCVAGKLVRYVCHTSHHPLLRRPGEVVYVPVAGAMSLRLSRLDQPRRSQIYASGDAWS